MLPSHRDSKNQPKTNGTVQRRAPTSKKPYHKPQLAVYGNIDDLRRRAGKIGPDMGD